MPLLGETVCLVTALLWAFSITLFRAPIAAHGARTVNMAKCVLGATLQGITVLLLGLGAAVSESSGRHLLLLGASGVIGLALGDTALFGAVSRIGVHRTLLLQTLAPVFAAALAVAWQGEIPTGRQGLGAAIVLAGVALVVAPRRGRVDRADGWDVRGIAAAVLAAASQGTGVVLAKAALDDVPIVAASFVRLSAAALALLAIGFVGGRTARLPGLVRDDAFIRRVVPATFLGTYLALFTMMAGLALAPAAVAAVLISTSPVFSLILDSVRTRRMPPTRALLGTLLALAGVAVLALG